MPAASVRAAAAAVTFLTRVPIGRRLTLHARDVARGTLLFPIVGAGVGACAGGVALLLHAWLPPLAAGALAVATAVLLTGGMHVDALADTFDAAGASSRQQALQIMRDPRIGSFGAVAIVLDLLVKASAVSWLLERGAAISALVAAGAVSRVAAPPLAVLLPYPRAEGGPGSVLTGRVSAVTAALAVALGVGIAVAVAGETGLVVAGGVAVSTTFLGLVYRRCLGGATGDCLGAATEIAETLSLVIAVALA